MTIHDLEGNEIIVTDYKAALNQAENFVKMHEEAKLIHLTDSKVRYFPDAHRQWVHILKQLQRLKTQ